MKTAIVSFCTAASLGGLVGNHALAEGYVGVAVGQAEIENVDDTSLKIFGGYRAASIPTPTFPFTPTLRRYLTGSIIATTQCAQPASFTTGTAPD